MHIERHRTDILIIGAGGAGLFAALHAKQANPDLDVTIAVKGLMGKCGCTRMVQGGYNVALARAIPSSATSWTPSRAANGCPGRTSPGNCAPRRLSAFRSWKTRSAASSTATRTASLHQKAFAGQTFDRTVHKGDLTGIEIINRLMEQVRARGVERAGGASRARHHPGEGRLGCCRRAADRHARRRLPLRAGQGRAAGERRRTDDVSLSHALGRQVLRRAGDGAALRAGPARHGDGAVPPDRPARRAGHAHDRHGAGRGPARRGRLPAQRARRALHAQV